MFIDIFLLILLIIINGIFSATEMAFLSLNKYELSKEIKSENKKARKILNLLNDSSTFLAVIQISITLSGFLASAYAAENFASELSNILNVEFLTTNVLIIVITIVLSYFTLVFGELIPKRIGLIYSKSISFMMVDVINVISFLFKPFVVILRSSVDFFIKLFNIKTKEENDEDNIKENIVDASLEEFEKNLLLNVFQFNDTIVKEAMTSLDDTVLIDITANKEEVLTILKKYKYTRYPIIKDDKIIGMLNVKDLMIKNKNEFKLEDYVRNITKVDSNMIIDDAFLMLRTKHEVMACVTEKKKIVGIITIEDIIEEVIGNVFDEYN